MGHFGNTTQSLNATECLRPMRDSLVAGSPRHHPDHSTIWSHGNGRDLIAQFAQRQASGRTNEVRRLSGPTRWTKPAFMYELDLEALW